MKDKNKEILRRALRNLGYCPGSKVKVENGNVYVNGEDLGRFDFHRKLFTG